MLKSSTATVINSTEWNLSIPRRFLYASRSATCRCSRNGRSDGMRCESCAAGTEVAYAAYESARTRKTVSLPLQTQFAPFEILQHPARPALNSGQIVFFWPMNISAEAVEKAFTKHWRKPPDGKSKPLRPLAESPPPIWRERPICYFTTPQGEASAETQTALREWVARGKPLLIVHAALGAYPQWEEFARWAGRVWVWNESNHPYQESLLRTSVEGGRILGWEEAWLPRDEVFIKLGQRSPCLDLATVQIPEGTFPAAWITKNIPTSAPGCRDTGKTCGRFLS